MFSAQGLNVDALFAPRPTFGNIWSHDMSRRKVDRCSKIVRSKLCVIHFTVRYFLYSSVDRQLCSLYSEAAPSTAIPHELWPI